MESDLNAIRRLSNDQVNELLGLGLERSTTADVKNPLELIEPLSHPDSVELACLFADLQSDLLWCSAGPLSFHRLVDTNREFHRQARGRTVVSVLTSASASRAVLEKLAEYGRLLYDSPLPDDARRAGLVIHVAASSALFAVHNVEMAPFVKQLRRFWKPRS